MIASGLLSLPLALGATADAVRDGSLLIAAPIAAAAGLVSFLSPCVLPLVPGYLSFITGMSATEIAEADLAARVADEPNGADDGSPRSAGSAAAAPDGSGPDGAVVQLAAVDAPAGTRHPHRRIVLGTLGFVLGFSVVFVSFGAAFGGLGGVLQAHEVLLTRIFGVITIVLGLAFAGVLSRFAVFNREVRFHRIPSAGLIGAPILGAMFAFGWTPCIGPTLSAVLGLAASNEGASAARGAFLSLCYCLGLGIPFLLTGLLFERAMTTFAFVKRHYRLVMSIGGGLLIVIGVLQVTGLWSSLVDALQNHLANPDLPI